MEGIEVICKKKGDFIFFRKSMKWKVIGEEDNFMIFYYYEFENIV